MLKNFTLIIAFIISAFAVNAQLDNGVIAPDFTVTDIDNNTHNLYTYLNEGKGVVMDLSASWCAPCWVYHQQHILEDLWQDRGPDGDNSLVVLFIESEAENTINQIFGVDGGTPQTSTQGDWTEGVSYPIIDDASVGVLYNLSFFPTIYAIRPDGRVLMAYDVFFPTQEFLEYYLLNGANNDAGIFDFIGDRVFCGDVMVEESVDVMNFGNENLTSFTLEAVNEDGGDVISSFDWTGEINPFGTATVTLPSFSVNEPTLVSYRVSNPNGVKDENTDLLQSIDSVSFANLPTRQTLNFRMRTDFWPEEITFRMLDENNSVIFSNAEFGPLACDAVYERTIQLPASGCYTFVLEDSFGDGLLNGPINPGQHTCMTPNGQANMAMGEITITSNDGTVLFDNIAYGEGVAFPITAESTTAISEVEQIENLTVFPNPVSDLLNIDFSLTESTEMQVSVFNMIGQEVYTFGNDVFQNGLNQLQLDASSLSEGVYFLSFQTKEGVSSTRFSVSR